MHVLISGCTVCTYFIWFDQRKDRVIFISNKTMATGVEH